MSNKRHVFKHFLNTDNVPDARMFTGKLFHSRGTAAPNAENGLATQFVVMIPGGGTAELC